MQCEDALKLITWAAATAILLPVTALAQQPVPPQPPTVQPSNDWEKLQRMQLERQFAGPLQDTIIQRWRDTVDGTVCYIYLPITVQHTPPTQNGFVQYGGNIIGSISCLAPTQPQSNAPPPTRPPVKK